jgi:hypothetical protein
MGTQGVILLAVGCRQLSQPAKVAHKPHMAPMDVQQR